MLKVPIILLVERISFEIMKLKDVQLLKMNENVDDITIYKDYDMIQNKRFIINAKFELVLPNQIIINHGQLKWLNDFQFKSFDEWKNDNMTNEIIFTYNDESFNNKIIIIINLIQKLPANVVIYQLENNYHIHRMDDKQMRNLLVNVFSKVKRLKRVPVKKVKTITLPFLPDIMIPDP